MMMALMQLLKPRWLTFVNEFFLWWSMHDAAPRTNNRWAGNLFGHETLRVDRRPPS